MATKSVKRNFYIPESYTLGSDHMNPSTVISRTPFLSSSDYVGGLRPYYQQSKLSLTSTALPLSSVGIHTTDDDSLDTSSAYNSLPSDEV
jgi:hypothetical protein